MFKVLSQLALCATALLSAFAVAAEESEELQVHASVDLAKGVCADPAMTDEDRAEMVSRSLEDAVACMGHEWVYGDRPLIETSALGSLDIDANVSANRIRVTDRNGKMHPMLTSPGLPGTKTETLTGEFFGPFRVEGKNYVVQNPNVDYTGAPMPYAVFYNWRAAKDTGFAIHGTNAVRQLGRPASHGCLRVRTPDAAFINAQVRQSNDESVRIYVYGKVASGAIRPKARRPRAPVEEPDVFAPRRSRDSEGFPRSL